MSAAWERHAMCESALSVLSTLVLNIDIQKTKVIFAVFGVQTAVLMEVRIVWNAFPAPIGCRRFGVRIFPKCR